MNLVNLQLDDTKKINSCDQPRDSIYEQVDFYNVVFWNFSKQSFNAFYQLSILVNWKALPKTYLTKDVSL